MKNIFKMLVGCVLISTLLFPHASFAQDGEDEVIGFWEQCATPENLPDEVKLGVVFGLTGSAAQYGVTQQQGVLLAVEEINESGYLGESTLIALVEDGGSDREASIAAMTKLVDQDEVSIVLGPTLSSQAFGADPIAAEAGVPVIGVSNTATGLTTMNNDDELDQFIFRNSLPESGVIPNTVATAVEVLGIEKVAVLYGDDDDFTFSGYEVFVDSLEELGVEILTEETFSRGTLDFDVQLTNILAEEPDAIVVSALVAEAVPIVTQARQKGYEGPIVGGNGFNTPALISQSGESSEGVIVGAAWNIINPSPLNIAFSEAYTELYNSPPDQFATQAYVGAWLAATAIRCADSDDPLAVRDALADIVDFDSPLGVFSFDEIRDPVHPPVVQIVDGGEFAVFDESYADFYE